MPRLTKFNTGVFSVGRGAGRRGLSFLNGTVTARLNGSYGNNIGTSRATKRLDSVKLGSSGGVDYFLVAQIVGTNSSQINIRIVSQTGTSAPVIVTTNTIQNLSQTYNIQYNPPVNGQGGGYSGSSTAYVARDINISYDPYGRVWCVTTATQLQQESANSSHTSIPFISAWTGTVDSGFSTITYEGSGSVNPNTLYGENGYDVNAGWPGSAFWAAGQYDPSTYVPAYQNIHTCYGANSSGTSTGKFYVFHSYPGRNYMVEITRNAGTDPTFSSPRSSGYLVGYYNNAIALYRTGTYGHIIGIGAATGSGTQHAYASALSYDGSSLSTVVGQDTLYNFSETITTYEPDIAEISNGVYLAVAAERIFLLEYNGSSITSTNLGAITNMSYSASATLFSSCAVFPFDSTRGWYAVYGANSTGGGTVDYGQYDLTSKTITKQATVNVSASPDTQAMGQAKIQFGNAAGSVDTPPKIYLFSDAVNDSHVGYHQVIY